MSRRGVLLALLLLGIAAAAAIWFVSRYELQPRQVPGQPSGEARSNPLYAAELLINSMGLAATSASLKETLDSLPGADTTLLLASPHAAIDDSRALQLISWMQSGGRLLLGADAPLAIDDVDASALPGALLQRLGLSLEPRWPALQPQTLQLPDGATNCCGLQLEQHWQLHGVRSGDQVLQDEFGLLLFYRPIGDGGLVLLPDSGIFSNSRIGSAQHASLLWQLLHWQTQAPREVWLIHSSGHTPLWSLLRQHAQPALLSLLLLALLLLLRGAYRLGPLLPAQQAPRRQLLQHIAASGRFYWQHQQQQRLLQATRQALLQRARQRHPALLELDASEIGEHIARLTDTPAAQLSLLLQAPPERNAEQFSRTIQQLETLRNQL